MHSAAAAISFIRAGVGRVEQRVHTKGNGKEPAFFFNRSPHDGQNRFAVISALELETLCEMYWALQL
jgi:hypothetical protein